MCVFHAHRPNSPKSPHITLKMIIVIIHIDTMCLLELHAYLDEMTLTSICQRVLTTSFVFRRYFHLQSSKVHHSQGIYSQASYIATTFCAFVQSQDNTFASIHLFCENFPSSSSFMRMFFTIKFHAISSHECNV